jgi:putative ABC transport system permease protein
MVVKRPPLLAQLLLRVLLPKGILRESIAGDLKQEFARQCASDDARTAARWYLREVLSLTGYGLRCRLSPHRRRASASNYEPVGSQRTTSPGLGGFMPSNVLTDVRHALRALRRNPGPVLMSVVSLALGIGVTATMVSVVDAIDFRPLPYRDADRVVQLAHMGEGGLTATVTPQLFEAWQAGTRSYDGLAAATVIAVAIGDDGNHVFSGARVTGDFLQLMGAVPIVGRTFTSEEVRAGARVAVISHNAWRTVFGGNPEIVGRTVPLSWAGEFRSEAPKPFTIVGVLPAGARYPRGNDVWLPAWDALGGMVTVLGRLRPDASIGSARAEMETLNRQIADGAVLSLREAIQERAGQRGASARFLLLAIAGLVLLIAVINVTVVFIVRAGRQQHDLLIRAALGAPRSRLITLMLAQSLLVCLVAGGLGVLLSSWGIRLADARLSVAAAGLAPVLDWRVVAAGVILSVAAGLVVGLLPASKVGRTRVYGNLGMRTAVGVGGVSGGRVRGALVVVQVACALVLLNSAGVLTRDFLRVVTREPGFDPDRLVVARLQIENTASQSVRLADGVANLPGVVSAALDGFPARGFWYSHENGDSLRSAGPIEFRRVSADYFSTLGIPVLAGRAFTPADREGAALVAIVSQAAARAWWAGESPIGKRLFMDRADMEGQWATIVGMTGDELVDRNLRAPVTPILYHPWRQLTDERRRTALLVRTAAEPASMIPQIKSVIREMQGGEGWQGGRVDTMGEILGSYLDLQRFRTSALTLFSVFAIVLASMGIYGVVASVVHQRTPEIGVRVALGARPQNVIALVTRGGIGLALIGTGLGVAGALGAHKVLASLGVTSGGFDLVAMLGAATLLAVMVAVACYVPGRRASHIDPTIALRE